MTTVPSYQSVLQTLWAHAHDPNVSDYKTIEKIKEESQKHKELADDELKKRADQLKCKEPNSYQNQLVAAFALVNEAARRTLGINYYEVQLLAGMALAGGAIAEMQTGEGKTFVAALPALLFSLEGRGVHVMTVNAYLAERDCDLLTPLYNLLGMSTGFLKPQASPDEKRQAYLCDITYGPGYEFGFDYLRDQSALLTQRNGRAGDTLRRRLRGDDSVQHQSAQRSHAFAIIDEIDSVLIDEASSPLILSEGSREPARHTQVYQSAKGIADRLVADRDFVVEQATRQVRLTIEGARKSAQALKQRTEHGLQRPWATYVEQALRAQRMHTRDVDYIVADDAIVLVDQSTGRIFRDRSLRDGLHQAIEAKEGVTITGEQRPLARIPRQRYLRLYDVACGMTGTASGSERELWEFYRLKVIRVPLRKESRRVNRPPRFFNSQQAKWAAIVKEIACVQETRQPVLVGTRTIEDSLELARQLDELTISYRVLNGVQDADEASVIARAGEPGAVTIATNMAGRGTDIKLAPDSLALGGLHVIATEPQESARVDRQLIGRCARQGDPGSCQLFVSFEDQLIQDYAPALAIRMQRMANFDGELEGDLSAELARVQRKAERLNYARRRRLFAHDTWMDGVLSTLAKEA